MSQPNENIFIDKNQSRYRYWTLLLSIISQILFVLFFAFSIEHLKAQAVQSISQRDSRKDIALTLVGENQNTIPPFMEANPDAPENIPDDNYYTSNRNQQASQLEEHDEGSEYEPTYDGELEDLSKILPSDLPEEPQPFIPPSESGSVVFTDNPQEFAPEEFTAQEPTESEDTHAVASEKPMETPDLLQGKISDAEEGEDIPLIKNSDGDTLDPQQRIVSLDTPSINPNADASQGNEQATRPTQLPRPKVNPALIPGAARKVSGRASSLGYIGIQSRFSTLGDYQQKMLEAISTQWHALARDYNFAADDIGSEVKIVFTLLPDGRIDSLKIVENTASKGASLICEDAIRSRAPFGEWTKEMLNILSSKEEVIFTFYYR